MAISLLVDLAPAISHMTCNACVLLVKQDEASLTVTQSSGSFLALHWQSQAFLKAINFS